MYAHSTKIRRLRGFTLIELLVVVAIIALLISILLPSLSRARDTARQVKCTTILKQIGMANEFYKNDFRGYVVPIANFDISGWAWLDNPHFNDAFGKEDPGWGWGTPDGLICPDAEFALLPENKPDWANNTANIAWSYGQNSQGEGVGDWWQANDQGFWAHLFTSVRSPSQKIFYMDSLDWNTPGYRGAERYTQYGEFAGTAEQHGMWAHRHLYDGENGVMNALFFDGHAEGLSAEEADPTGPNGSWQNLGRIWDPYSE